MRQRNIPWLGVLVDSLYTSLPILSIINFLSIMTVLYVEIKENLLPWAPWLEFWMFVAGMSVWVVIMMALMYLFVLPSLWTFRNKQMNMFESDVLKEVRELRKEIGKLKGEQTSLAAKSGPWLPRELRKVVDESRAALHNKEDK